MKISSLRISARFIVSFSIVFLIIVALSTISVQRVSLVNHNLAQINDVNSVKQRYAINFRGSVHDRAIALRDVSLVTTAGELEEAISTINRLADSYAASAAPLDEMLASADTTPDERAIVESIKATEALTGPLISRVVEMQRAGDAIGARQVLMQEARPMFVQWLSQINAFIDLQEAKNQKVATETRTIAEGFALMTLLLCLGALVVGGAGAIWALRSIKPLRELTRAMERLAAGDFSVLVPGATLKDEVGEIARAVEVFKDGGVERLRLQAEAASLKEQIDERHRQAEAASQIAGQEQQDVVDALAMALNSLASGDLTSRIDARFEGRYGQIKTDFQSAVDSLRDAMTSISATTGGIRRGVGEIASGFDDLSRRTEQQAASLEETAAALDEITATVRQSAEGARDASVSASGARGAAARSGEVMREAVVAMTEIQASSGKITNIISVIDEIAFQTNLLALNAGVEAARAGDAGRGFAVVAQEVRALAQRSAEAAKEIKALIASSSSQVERGVTLVGQTELALTDIVDKVAEIDGLISEIAQSSQEQATGLAQVNVAVNQMDQVTQQNAAMVEQVTAAATSLDTETGELSRLVMRFDTGASAPRAGTTAVRPVRPVPVTTGHRGEARNPVARIQARVANYARSGSAAAIASDPWEEF
ncbi:MAG: HAMP domain-containing protein [Caulobacteraceae bacterium]|nr:HAMP domain-containing protein [Caulobacteraceae bacterium]